VAPVLIPLLGDPLAAADAIAALRRYSLVTLVGDGSVMVHRLVPVFAHGISLREPAGPADVDIEEVE